MVEAVRHGLSNPQIARRQGVSVEAVKYHVANALGKLGFSRRSGLRLWAGVRRDSVLFGKEWQMDAVEVGPIGQIARTVTDIGASRAWYEEVLGLKHLYSFGTMAFFDCGGIRLMLSEGEAAAESILYFRVEDVRSTHATLAARGVTFVAAPHIVHRHADGTEEWMAFFHDPEARPLAIMAQVKG